MIATRRRGYGGKSYPVVEVIHPDAYMVSFTTTTANQEVDFINQYSFNNITKAIVDGIVYEGDDIKTALKHSKSSNTTAFSRVNPELLNVIGRHEVYLYLKEWNGYGGKPIIGRLGNPDLTVRFARNSVSSYVSYYNFDDIFFVDRIPTIEVLGGQHIDNLYVPYNADTSTIPNQYQSKIIPVKYKFIEDE